MPGRTVKITEVAAASGVGVGTVSRVLNGGKHVSDRTRERVLAVIDDLGYRPSRLATALVRGATRSVAVLVPFLTRPSTMSRLVGVLSSLEHEGLDPIVCNVEHPDQLDRMVQSFADPHRAGGILLLSLRLSPAQQAAIRESGVPLAAVDVDCPGVPRVLTDDMAGGRLATEHLIELGHSRIAFIGDLPNHEMHFTSTHRRLKGYRSALASAGLEADLSLARRIEHGPMAAQDLAIDLLGSGHPPTAIFAASDTQAIGVLRAAEKMGVRVPDDLSVVGFDDIDAAEVAGLTTVRQPLYRSGELGGLLIGALTRSEPAPRTRHVLPLELIPRTSTSGTSTSADLERRPAPT